MLICGEERFPVHKVIVCSQSKVFRAACSKPFRVSNHSNYPIYISDIYLTPLKEAASGEYRIEEQSLAVVRRMVDYFYTGDYGDPIVPTQTPDQCPVKPESSNEEELPPLRLHARMFALADMYQVDHLQTLAVNKYGKAVDRTSSFQDLLDSIPDVYQLTPSSVRALRDKAIIAFRAELERAPRSGDWPFETSSPDQSGQHSKGAADALIAAYDEVAAETPEFLKDLLNSYIRAPLLGQCSHCGKERPRPAEALQMKCLKCGKGGASSWRFKGGGGWW